MVNVKDECDKRMNTKKDWHGERMKKYGRLGGKHTPVYDVFLFFVESVVLCFADLL